MLEQYLSPEERPKPPDDSLWQFIGPQASWNSYLKLKDLYDAQEFRAKYGRNPIGGGGAAGAPAAAASQSGTGAGLGAGGVATGMEGAGSVTAPAAAGTGLGSKLGAASTILGSMSDARSNANMAQNTTAMSLFDRMLAASIAERLSQSQRAQDIRTAPGDRMQQQMQSNLIQGWKPVSVQSDWAKIPNVTGGVPAFNAGTLELAGLNSADALARARQGQAAPDITPIMQTPEAPQMSSANWLDSLLGYGGAAAGLLSLFTKK